MCKPHKVCSAGQWTKAVGTPTTDTECADCPLGTWREVDPQTNNVVAGNYTTSIDLSNQANGIYLAYVTINDLQKTIRINLNK